MKKILIITMEFPPQVGGIATYVRDLAGALPGDQVVVLTQPNAAAKAWDASQPFRIIRAPFFFPRFIWPRWLRLYFTVRAIIKAEKIELLMIHHALPVGYVGVMMKRILKIPFLLFSHGTDLIAGTATPWKKRMMKKVVDAAEQVVFNSNSLRQRFLGIFSQYADKSVVMYPCPEATFLESPAQADLEALRRRYALQGKKVILSVARLDDGKGFPHAVRLMPEILKKNPNVVWFIIGDGKKRDDLLARIQKANLQNVVRYIGSIPHDEVKAFFYLADVFLLLTHPDEGREEGLGLVFLEAAAAGIPVVAGRSGGVDEAVLHEKTGYVFDVHTADKQIVEATVALLGNNQLQKTLGDAGRARMQTQFVWSEQLKVLERWLS